MSLLDQLFRKRRRAATRILVVDDEKPIRKAIALHLSRLDAEVIQAASTAEAVAALEGEDAPFDAFVLDIIMPGENGIHLARRIRETPRYRQTPILVLSGAFPPSQLEKVKAQIPRVSFLTKPFKADALVVAVQQMLTCVKA